MTEPRALIWCSGVTRAHQRPDHHPGDHASSLTSVTHERRSQPHRAEALELLKLWSYCTVLPDNVLFFDRRTGSASQATQRLWVYDLRTNQHFTLKTRPLQRADLDEFVAPTRSALDRFWLKDDSILDSYNLPDPDLIATEITGDLRSALEQMEAPQGDQEYSSAP